MLQRKLDTAYFFIREDGRTFPYSNHRLKTYQTINQLQYHSKHSAHLKDILKFIHLYYGHLYEPPARIDSVKPVYHSQFYRESFVPDAWTNTLRVLEKAGIIYRVPINESTQPIVGGLFKTCHYNDDYRYTDPTFMRFVCYPILPPEVTYENCQTERKQLKELSLHAFLKLHKAIEKKYAILGDVFEQKLSIAHLRHLEKTQRNGQTEELVTELVQTPANRCMMM